MGGLCPAVSDIASNIAAACSRRRSFRWPAASWTPMGIPFDDIPNGTDMAGCPVIPNVAVMLAACPASAVRPDTSNSALS